MSNDKDLGVEAEVTFVADEASIRRISDRVREGFAGAFKPGEDLSKNVDSTFQAVARAMGGATTHGSFTQRAQMALMQTATSGLRQVTLGLGQGATAAAAFKSAMSAINPVAAGVMGVVTAVGLLTHALSDDAAAWQEAVRKAEGFALTMDVTAKEGARLNNFFNEFGISADRATQIMRRMSLAIENGAFHKLGIDVQMGADGLPDMTANLLKLSEAYNKAGSAAERNNIAKVGFGIRGGGGVGADGSLTNLTRLLEQGPEKLRDALGRSGGDLINGRDVDKMNELQYSFRRGSEAARQFHEELGKLTVPIQELAASAKESFWKLADGILIGTKHGIQRVFNLAAGNGFETYDATASQYAKKGVEALTEFEKTHEKLSGLKFTVNWDEFQAGIAVLINNGSLANDELTALYDLTQREPGKFGSELAREIANAAAQASTLNGLLGQIATAKQTFGDRYTAQSQTEIAVGIMHGDTGAAEEMARRAKQQQQAMLDLPGAESAASEAASAYHSAVSKAAKADREWVDRNKKSRSDQLNAQIKSIEHAKAERDATIRITESKHALAVQETTIARFKEDEPRRTRAVADAEESLMRARRDQGRVAKDLARQEFELDHQRTMAMRDAANLATDTGREARRANEDLAVSERDLADLVVDQRRKQAQAIEGVAEAARTAREALDNLNDASMFKKSGGEREALLAGLESKTILNQTDIARQAQRDADALRSAVRAVEDARVRVRDANYAVADVQYQLRENTLNLADAETALADARHDKVVDAAKAVSSAEDALVDARRNLADIGPELIALEDQLARSKNEVKDAQDAITIARMRDEYEAARDAEQEQKRIESLAEARESAHQQAASALARMEEAADKSKYLKFIIGGGTDEDWNAAKSGVTLDKLFVSEMDAIAAFLKSNPAYQIPMKFAFKWTGTDRTLLEQLAAAMQGKPKLGPTLAESESNRKDLANIDEAERLQTDLANNERGGFLAANRRSWVNEKRQEFAVDRAGKIEPILGGPQIRKWDRDVEIIPSVAALAKRFDSARLDRPSIGQLVVQTQSASTEGAIATVTALAHVLAGV